MSYPQGPPPPPDPWANPGSSQPPYDQGGYPPPDAPTSGQPTSGQPASGQPTSGQPMSGQPMSPPGYDPGYGQPGYPPPGYGPPPPPPPPPGGYGQPAYGQPYGPAVATENERTMGMLAHLLGLATGFFLALPFLGPLIIYLVKKDESRFVRHHAAEALNVTLTGLIVSVVLWVVGCVLSVIVIGVLFWFLLIPYGILLLVYMIIAAIAANRGEWYTYPTWLRIPMVS